MPVVSPPSVTALPTPPSTSSPSSFDTRADAFLAALPTFQTQTDALAANVFANATDAAANATTASTGASTATTQASAASASAASAIAAPGTQATSTTSLAVGSGSKSLTIQASKAYSVGQSIVIADTSAPSSNWMFGQITSYNSGTGALVVNVAASNGSGTTAAWTISISSSPATPTVTVVGADLYTHATLGGF